MAPPSTLLRAALLFSILVPPLGGRAVDEPEPVRFVRIELRGPKRTLSLAEVQVVRNGRNVAEWGKATQSGTASSGEALRAVDGNSDGQWSTGSVTHTPEMDDPWWELDLAKPQVIDQITVWNRTDCCSERLQGFCVLALDEERRVLWSRLNQPAPAPRRDFSVWGTPVVRLDARAVDRAKLQPAIGAALDRGTRYLMRTQQRDGSWGAHAQRYGCGQTALSVYALLKGGVPRTHPSVARGIAYIEANPPSETYSIGCALMALGAYGDERLRPLMEDLVAELEQWQNAPNTNTRRLGMWGYPTGQADLSNSQYAALGLRAAELADVEVAKQTWLELLQGVLLYQEAPRAVEVVGVTAKGEPSDWEGAIAGFRYHSGQGPISGSMTTAGVSTLAICEWALGDALPKRLRERVERARNLGLAWLANHYSVTANPGRASAHVYYYLYGLERVGGVLGIDTIGAHDWYWEGSEALIGRQSKGGEWGGPTDTCFATLFLSRATSVSGRSQRSVLRAHIAESPEADVRWRVTGVDPATMFVTGFGAAALNDFDEPEGLVRGLRVLRVDYQVDGEVVCSLRGNPERGWKDERFAAQHRFTAPGTYELTAHVHVVDPFVAEGQAGSAELVSEPIEIAIEDLGDAAMTAYVRHAVDNLLAERAIEASASSEKSDEQSADHAFDGLHSTAWVADPAEAVPRIAVELKRPVRANTILISHVDSSPSTLGRHDRATKAILRVNRGQTPYELSLDGDGLRKTVFRLPRTVGVRRFSIEIVEREKGRGDAGAVGFSEIELLLVR